MTGNLFIDRRSYRVVCNWADARSSQIASNLYWIARDNRRNAIQYAFWGLRKAPSSGACGPFANRFRRSGLRFGLRTIALQQALALGSLVIVWSLILLIFAGLKLAPRCSLEAYQQ